MPLRDKAGKQIILRPVRANAGIRAMYRRRLLALVDEMAASYEHWMKATYRKNEPAILQAMDSVRRSWALEFHDTVITKPERAPPDAHDFSYIEETQTRVSWIVMDATPAKELERTLKKLAKQWESRFDEAAEDLAAYFAKAAANRSDAALRSILKRGGFSVKFRMTRAMRDAVAAIVAENVSLIRSIPSEYATGVEGLVMRSVTAGRDLSTLSTELQARYGVSKRKAELISRDQNNKATGALQRVRYIEMGIKQAIWLHSGGGKKPRPTHVRNSGKRYDVAEGWYDPAVKKFIQPGELINCRCVARPVVKGFS